MVLRRTSALNKAAIDAALNASGDAESSNLAPTFRSLMVHAVQHAGASILFFQAENDYTVAPSRELYAAMREAKKPAKIRLYPPEGKSPKDGTGLPYRRADIGRDDVFRFLDERCLAKTPRRIGTPAIPHLGSRGSSHCGRPRTTHTGKQNAGGSTIASIWACSLGTRPSSTFPVVNRLSEIFPELLGETTYGLVLRWPRG